jgi:hypothetical protein
LQAIVVEVVLSSQAITWKEWVADNGIGCIVRVHFETVDINFFEAEILTGTTVDKMNLHALPLKRFVLLQDDGYGGPCLPVCHLCL